MAEQQRTWQQRVVQAEHYLAVGHQEIFLGDGSDGTDRPWEYVTRVEIRDGEWVNNVRFHADHPSGLSFLWNLDLEKQTGYDEGDRTIVQQAHIVDALCHLPDEPRQQLRAYLGVCAALHVKYADNYQRQADEEHALATQYMEIARQ